MSRMSVSRATSGGSRRCDVDGSSSSPRVRRSVPSARTTWPWRRPDWIAVLVLVPTRWAGDGEANRASALSPMRGRSRRRGARARERRRRNGADVDDALAAVRKRPGRRNGDKRRPRRRSGRRLVRWVVEDRQPRRQAGLDHEGVEPASCERAQQRREGRRTTLATTASRRSVQRIPASASTRSIATATSSRSRSRSVDSFGSQRRSAPAKARWRCWNCPRRRRAASSGRSNPSGQPLLP
jgi:hypothetical protein